MRVARIAPWPRLRSVAFRREVPFFFATRKYARKQDGPPSNTAEGPGGSAVRDERSPDVLRQLRQSIRPEEISGLSDAQLLRRWAAQRDEAAFEILLWRHGPMVLDVCRRILRDGHRAEDAFQATFLT